MFHRIRDFTFIDVDGRAFRPRLYGEPQAGGSWAGWIVFFPLAGGVAIAPPSPETTQRTLAALEVWAAAVTVVHLEGALDRALRVAEQSPVVSHLVDAEYQALDEAAWLESAAQLERAAADLDQAAAKVAAAAKDRRRAARAQTRSPARRSRRSGTKK